MAAQAETINTLYTLEPESASPDRRPYLHVLPMTVEGPAQLAEETELGPHVRAEFARWMGSLALAPAEIETTKPKVNILERLQAAKTGSQEALKWLATNIGTAIFEVVFKEGYISSTYMDRSDDGELSQFGQTNDSVYRNAMVHRPNRHKVLQGITEIEGRNRFYIEAALKSGKFKDYYFVATSLVPDGVPEKELGPDGDGYFLDSLTLNLQVTSELENGKLKTETAFMAGVEADDNDDFEARLAKRHDFKAMNLVRGRLGLKPAATAAEHLEGIFVPKELMPNGSVADLMYLLAKAGDEVLGRSVERDVNDFLKLQLESKRKEASLAPVREKVLADLLAATDGIEKPMDAVQLLWDLVEKHTVKESFTNLNIEPGVFGREAAPAIREIRKQLQEGNIQVAQGLAQTAYSLARSTACGGGGRGGPKPWWGARNYNKKEEGSEQEEEDLSHIAGKDDLGSRAFRCDNGHLNIRPYNGYVHRCRESGCHAKVVCK